MDPFLPRYNDKQRVLIYKRLYGNSPYNKVIQLVFLAKGTLSEDTIGSFLRQIGKNN